MVQEITTQSWGSRIVGAFFGVLIGLVLIIASFYVVFWNEGHGLHTAQSLQQTQQILISVPSSPIDSNNNMKVIYFTGLATTTDTLHDSLFGISDKVIKLNRNVEMYQWKQEEETKTEKQFGGSEQQVTTYTYKKVWSDNLIDSNNFKEAGHQNPASKPIESLAQQAKKVTVGDFSLPKNLISDISGAEDVDLSNVDLSNIQAKLKQTVLHDGNSVYVGNDPQIPAIGDLRIRIEKVIPQNVSIIAQQTGDTLQPYLAPAGQPVSLLVMGQESPEQMIHEAEIENEIMTWLIRLGTLIMMIIGISLLLRPIVVLADVVPFVGSLVGFGTGLVSFIVGLCLWAIATSIAWFVVRPIWSIGLIIIVIALCYILFSKKRNRAIVPK